MDRNVRPIDANALKKRAIEMEIFMPYGGDGTTMAVEVDAIESAPTLDYAPVRHGHYGFVGGSAIEVYVNFGTCSECKERVAWYKHNNYCPYCGARMDGKESK